jgi:hypothetical protein
MWIVCRYSFKGIKVFEDLDALKTIINYTYSCQLLICNPSSLTAQNASMNAVARRALVMLCVIDTNFHYCFVSVALPPG